MSRKTSLAEKLAEHSVAEPNSGCVLWLGNVDQKGYGGVRVDGVQHRAHRAAYELAVGPIPDGLQLDHLCRTPSCINPRHLEVVTSRENTLRGVSPPARNVNATHCIRGHDLAGTNVISRKGKPWRRCRVCERIRAFEYRQALRIAQKRIVALEQQLAALLGQKP